MKRIIKLIIIFNILLLNIFLFSGFSVSQINKSKYISKSDAKLMAIDFTIKRAHADKNCPWIIKK